jgi:hypothetical protein
MNYGFLPEGEAVLRREARNVYITELQFARLSGCRINDEKGPVLAPGL